MRTYCEQCGRTPACPAGSHPVDNIEINFCKEVDDDGGVEQCEYNEDPTMISVYVHRKDAGLECVRDFKLEEYGDATKFAQALARINQVEVSDDTFDPITS